MMGNMRNLGSRAFQGAVRGARMGKGTAMNVAAGMGASGSGRAAIGSMAKIQNRMLTKPISTGAATVGMGAMGAGGVSFVTGASRRGPGVTKNIVGNIPRGIYNY